MEKNPKKSIRRIGIKAALVLFDIFAVNFAYYMALILRFYVNHQIHQSSAFYFPLFYRFAPYYTVCCILVFWLFKLYSGMWKYAGWNDINRLIYASGVTCAIQVLGTLIFTQRMPITYYVIGAFIQFFLIVACRFSYRVVMIEVAKYMRDKKAAYIPVMVVGAGENAKSVLRQFDAQREILAKPVCVIDYHDRDTGHFFDGLPVVGGLDSVEGAIKKYKVKNVILADALMPEEARAKVRDICRDLNVDVHDFFPVSQTGGAGVPLRNLLFCAEGPVDVSINGAVQHFDSSEQAASAFEGKYRVKNISAGDTGLLIEVENDLTVLNNMNETWVQDYESETGETVSFF